MSTTGHVHVVFHNIITLFLFSGLVTVDEKLRYYETFDHISVESIEKRSTDFTKHRKHVKFSALNRRVETVQIKDTFML